MDTYSLMREFADSWAMLALFAMFIGVVFWAWRPGSRKMHDDSANIPFRHEDKPACSGDGPGGRGKDGAMAKEAWK
ncbi:CcoQ/FixQ family Cbb3-type cytochrome c oxidase assembly chaperone [Rhodobacter veldkampii DSM 11550]|uniref:CcoQ/FixQ family Cbb3-type cytochrome c oxidase assembly chaperone n=1 Tax=Phaeovulum veldkampii DSM 11550 TaxID=1185920 RepID=A0A2T4JJW2_9RHOB|nr:cbb3-type cytochrome c oxidase subunit 3 [Phaeovulum veldkampii]MBK5946075.1 CcoQ/FixQ family Cbb3-type cytochrome c oxidase assembly chaperone [Phaeovulum veldkampii DSM 11550]NCU20384.1 cbb3-type cytochrome c oxidase subunit 3 [Candidatus Falkowbacteria bacterium]PTE18175.1 CcoQ/FixQ family Cbb3-type cytochrome c oxidase assembly chaperone [Phaeovulum veldkampii DSM 11550]TDQ63525.1 cytochrome c oxidase cbb3-type subunit 4 [Phaeovulum veldkampii DSM 11550]